MSKSVEPKKVEKHWCDHFVCYCKEECEGYFKEGCKMRGYSKPIMPYTTGLSPYQYDMLMEILKERVDKQEGENETSR